MKWKAPADHRLLQLLALNPIDPETRLSKKWVRRVALAYVVLILVAALTLNYWGVEP